MAGIISVVPAVAFCRGYASDASKAKLKHWRGFPRLFGLRAAPMLVLWLLRRPM